MAFVRRKTIRGKTRYYLVKTFRENGKIRHRQCYLGSSPSSTARIALLKRKIKQLKLKVVVWNRYFDDPGIRLRFRLFSNRSSRFLLNGIGRRALFKIENSQLPALERRLHTLRAFLNRNRPNKNGQ